MVPGHEIVGRVTEIGDEVSRYKVGDAVAVGCMVDSCQQCDQCRKGEEQLCRKGNTQTYNDRDRITCEPTYGGYSKRLVVREEFVLRVPDGLDLSKAAPLVCAGITTYSPLRTWNVGPGQSRRRGRARRSRPYGRQARGGDGRRRHGHEQVERQRGRRPRARRRSAARLGRREGDGEGGVELRPHRRHGSGQARHQSLHPAARRRRHAGAGRADRPAQRDQHSVPLLLGRRRVAGSPIGGIAETQEMLDFCAKKASCRTVEMIRDGSDQRSLRAAQSVPTSATALSSTWRR